MGSAAVINTTCPYCGVGCGVAATRQTQAPDTPAEITAVAGLPDHPANLGRLCVKGSALHETMGQQGRLLHPKLNGCRTDWNTALDVVASGFQKIIRQHGPDAVAFYLSGQLLTEDYYVANKLMKGFMGTANVDTNSRLCMASAVAGYKRAFGADVVPCSYEDLELCDLLIISGSNAAWTHPILFQRIQAARKHRPEMKVVVIDPRRTTTCEIADLHLAIAPGSDAFLFTGLLGYLSTRNRLDEHFIQTHTSGFEAALKACTGLQETAVATGLDESQLEQFYRLFASTEKSITFYSQGINQSATGTDKCNAIINCHLATGRIGKPGMGPFSITGQPNAMGGREVGGLANQLAAHMDFSPENIDRVRRFWKAPGITKAPGKTAVAMFDAIERGEIKAVWIMATNPLVSLPESDRMRKALQSCELVVVSDCIENTDTSRCAHVLLPATGWGEKDGTVTNSERRISRQRAVLPAPGEAQHDWWIITQVARKMGFADAFNYETPAAIFREHAALSGFENTSDSSSGSRRAFNIAGLADLSDSNYENLSPVRWPISRGLHSDPHQPFADGRFFTPDEKARFVPVTARLPASTDRSRYPWLLNTGRIRDQWHTMTRTGRAAKLLQHTDTPFVAISTRDALSTGIRDGDLVRLGNQHGELLMLARIDQGQRDGEVFIPIHWNREFASAAVASALISSVVDPVSGQPESKYAGVTMQAVRVSRWLHCISDQPVDVSRFPYWVKVPAEGGWRYLLASFDNPRESVESLREWIQSLAIAGEKIEFYDSRTASLRTVIMGPEQTRFALFTAEEPAQLPDAGILEETLKHQPGADSWRLVSSQFAHSGSGKIVCSCLQVQETAIISAIRSGSTSVEALGRKLRCGTNCGSCVPELTQLLRRYCP